MCEKVILQNNKIIYKSSEIFNINDLLKINKTKSFLEVDEIIYLVYKITNNNYDFFYFIEYDKIFSFTFDDLPKVNIKEFNDEHLEIFKIIKSLENKTDENEILFTLNHLFIYVNYHFSHEEFYMIYINKVYNLHIEDHKKLLKELKLIIDNFNMDKLPSLNLFIKSWLLEHIILFDSLLD